jgi:hypothetical protein
MHAGLQKTSPMSSADASDTGKHTGLDRQADRVKGAMNTVVGRTRGSKEDSTFIGWPPESENNSRRVTFSM